jgi:hypothetical protein
VDASCRRQHEGAWLLAVGDAHCDVSLRPSEEGAYGFRAIIESDAAGQAPPVAGELRDEPVSAHGPDLAPDKLLSHVVITYEDEDGAPLGTAPPPAGIARVAPSRRDEPPAREPELAPMDDDTTPKPHKPPKSPKSPPKSPPKPDKRPIKTGKPDKASDDSIVASDCCR